MAEAAAFNLGTGEKAERNLLIAYVNTGTSATPVWEAMGLGVEDSSIDFDFGESIKTDILGLTGITMKAPTRKQSFEPCEIHEGSALQLKLYNAIRYERWSELMAMPEAQLKAGEWLISDVLTRYPVDIKRHKDFNATGCPGDNFPFDELIKEETELRYDILDEIPDWGKPTIQKLIAKGALKGTGEGFDISADMLRMFVINDRMGLYT